MSKQYSNSNKGRITMSCESFETDVLDPNEERPVGPIEYICGECGEIKIDSVRTEGGMKCGVCAYSG